MGTQDNRQTNNRVAEEWYECDRCGFNYPRGKMLVQNGLTLCQGRDTTNCADMPGHAAEKRRLILPEEEITRGIPLPKEDIDL